MKRTYRIAVTVEATFDRKVASRSHARAVRERVESALPEPWRVAEVHVSSRARPERTVPSPGPKDAAIAKLVSDARAIYAEMKSLDPMLPNATIRFYTDGCGRSNGNRAHVHPGKWWASREHGRRVRLPRNLICLERRYLRWSLRNPTDPDLYECLARTVAHELMHIRYPGHRDEYGRRHGNGAHRRAVFHGAIDALMVKWHGAHALVHVGGTT